MLDPNEALWLAVPLSISAPQLAPDVLLAYAGFGPGQELIPYFLALLTFAGAALLAVIQWPLSAMLRCLARFRGGRKEQLESESERIAANLPESPGEGSHNKS